MREKFLSDLRDGGWRAERRTGPAPEFEACGTVAAPLAEFLEKVRSGGLRL